MHVAIVCPSMASGSYERLGDATVDEQRLRISVPQQAVNLELLTADAEAFWGVRDDDGAVVVSHLYDPLTEEGYRYVASSQIDEDRTLSIPEAVFDHWNETAGDNTAITDGDTFAFATSEELRANSRLVIVPEERIDEVLIHTE